MKDNIIDFYPTEEVMLVEPSRIFLGYNKEDGIVTITFAGDDEGSEIGFVLNVENLIWLEKEMARVKKLAGL